MKDSTDKSYYHFSLLILAIVVSEYCFSKSPLEYSLFLLWPATAITSIFTGIPFLWSEGVGYVSHCGDIIINKGCAGTAFFLLTVGGGISVIILKKKSVSLSWGIVVVLFAWLTTVLANVSRIVLSIKLLAFDSSLFSSPGMHKAMGVLIFFPYLLFFQIVMSHFSSKVINNETVA